MFSHGCDKLCYFMLGFKPLSFYYICGNIITIILYTSYCDRINHVILSQDYNNYHLCL